MNNRRKQSQAQPQRQHHHFHHWGFHCTGGLHSKTFSISIHRCSQVFTGSHYPTLEKCPNGTSISNQPISSASTNRFIEHLGTLGHSILRGRGRRHQDSVRLRLVLVDMIWHEHILKSWQLGQLGWFCSCVKGVGYSPAFTTCILSYSTAWLCGKQRQTLYIVFTVLSRQSTKKEK